MARLKWLIPVVVVPLASLVLLCAAREVAARGCIKGAAVGAVAGHVAGHHAVLGAVAGCAVGHHMAKKQQRELRQQQLHPQAVPQPGQHLTPAVSPSGEAPQ